jgi:ParB family transcriptional regulator, chromosome partitioning protein
LAASIQAHGLMQPIVVRPVASGYELVAGHRRLEAARLLGWTEIAVIVRDEAYILTLVENLQREDLTPKEEASALEVLVRERGWTTRQVGEAIKRSHVYVSHRLRVFEDDVLAPMVLARGLTVSTAEELLRAPDPETRKELAGQAAEQQWTWGEARRAVAELGTVRSKWAAVAVHLRALINDSQEVEPDNLTPADRKLVRRAITALRRLA